MSHCARLLKRLMVKAHLTESELSRRTGIGQPVIHRISSGETDNPKIDTLLPLADYFGLDLSEFIGDHPLPFKYTDDQITATSLQFWQKVPLLNWTQVQHWVSHQQQIMPIRHTGCSLPASKEAFAIQMVDQSMMPRFPPGTVLIVDPALSPSNSDICIISVGSKNSKQPVMAQYTTQTAATDVAAVADVIDCYHPLNPDLLGVSEENDTCTQSASNCLGVVIQAVFS